MEESIKNFGKQFSFEPIIENDDSFNNKNFTRVVVGGMGGSHLAAGILQMILPNIEISIHRDYGLPEISVNSRDLEDILFIASSYSGNTEEVLDFAEEAYSRGLNLVIVTTGGKLLEFAKENNLPYVLMPDTKIQPRTALGYSILSIAKFVYPEIILDLALLKNVFDDSLLSEISNRANEMISTVENKIPVIYTSAKIRPIAYNWKIKFNETAKIPSFYNSFPELNHNEMQGYDYNENNKDLSQKFVFIFIKDGSESVGIAKRMDVLEKIYNEKGFDVLNVQMLGESKAEKIFSTLLLADFLAIGLAKKYNSEPEQVPLIEDFKNRLRQ